MKLPHNNCLLIFSALLLTSLFFYGCDEDEYYMADLSTVPEPYLDERTPEERIEHDNDLVIHVYEEGEGQFTVSDRDVVLVRYTGRLENGNIFDSSWVDGNENPMERSVQDMEEGLFQGMLGMHEGGVRTIVIPAELGYGSQGRGGGRGFSEIPPNSTITYDIELIEILD
ncbi:MAG: FKBP-type peptidyl-prolyl cis-trans isomerase [Balneolales bacterium]